MGLPIVQIHGMTIEVLIERLMLAVRSALLAIEGGTAKLLVECLMLILVIGRGTTKVLIE